MLFSVASFKLFFRHFFVLHDYSLDHSNILEKNVIKTDIREGQVWFNLAENWWLPKKGKITIPASDRNMATKIGSRQIQ